jgi:hypothetical protein
MMADMKGMTNLRRQAGKNKPIDIRGPLRVREPRGLIGAERATELLSPFVGAEIGASDTSMDRLVVAIATSPMHLLVVAGPLVVSTGQAAPTGGRALSVCHAPGSPEALTALDVVSGRRITDVTVSPSGGIRIGFDNGFISVDADSSYEAWEIRGMDGGLLACLPGGAISLWTPTLAPGTPAAS